jgi:hypothetical protein
MAYHERTLPVGHVVRERLVVLTGAREQVNCTDAELLEHLRLLGPHERGCWALDLVLAKE